MRLFWLIFAAAVAIISVRSPALAEHRIALVVGNSKYVNAPELVNPKNDARAVAAALRRDEFEVILGIDLNVDNMRQTLRKFAGQLERADVGLFYYAGHGLQINGQNFLVPVDAKLESLVDLEFETTSLQQVIDLMEKETRTTIVLLDACRDNPLARTLARSLSATRSVSIGRGLAIVEAHAGTFIAYATSPGSVALDGVGAHSPFTAGLLNYIEKPGLEVGQMMRRVRVMVRKLTENKQTPWDHSSLVGDFYFEPPPARPAGGSERPIFKSEPKPGTLKFGSVVYVDDGTCPEGQIKKVTGGNSKPRIKRKRECVPK